jgi:lipid II:glycine glycyltransferase (peptidoglycan interpeptide bridge formation enzyme)
VVGWVVFGDRAWALFSATSEEGRKVQASFGIFWAVIQHCQRLGVQSCDLAGIDPVGNHGVYRFKKGIGGVPLEYLGEWDWATSPWLRWLGNWGISRREQVAKATKLTQKALPVLITSAADETRLPADNNPQEARVA